MATTYLRPYKAAADMTAQQTMRDRFDYALNPRKVGAISAYCCDPKTADAEFMLTKAQYEAETGRRADDGNLFYQIRQAFPAGEITPEEANRIGYETAMRWTKGKYQFFVVTHVDREHIHNHIYYNSTARDRTRKWHNFWGSTFAVRRLSDRVCLEHGLSIVKNPKQHSKGKYKHYGQWQEDNGGREPTFQQRLKDQIDICLAEQPGSFDAFLQMLAGAGFEVKHGRGGVLSFRALAYGQDRFTRLRSETLGEGYGPEELRAIIEGRAPLPAGRRRPSAGSSDGGINLIVDIQQRMKEGKGPGYEQWAKIHNLKQMAATLQFLQENDLLDYAQLDRRASDTSDRFHKLSVELREAEAVLSVNAELKAASVDYAKTRPIFDGYKAAGYSKKYLAEYEGELALYRAAQATFRRLLDGERLPKMDALKAEGRELTTRKKATYAEYNAAKKEMRDVVTAKGNIDRLLGITGPGKNKEMQR